MDLNTDVGRVINAKATSTIAGRVWRMHPRCAGRPRWTSIWLSLEASYLMTALIASCIAVGLIAATSRAQRAGPDRSAIGWRGPCSCRSRGRHALFLGSAHDPADKYLRTRQATPMIASATGATSKAHDRSLMVPHALFR